MNNIPELPDPLPENVLQQRTQLPLKPQAVVLTGTAIRLEPLEIARDAAQLYAISNGQPATIGARSIAAYDADALIWRFMSDGPFATFDSFCTFLARIDLANARCFCVFDSANSSPIGVATYLNNSPNDLKIELGNIWYSPLAQGTGANREATYLMLRHAFDLGYRRLEWKCNALNERSRRAALRMGFRFEGIQERHMIVKNCNRDTAWFRILESEWPQVRIHLEQFLAG